MKDLRINGMQLNGLRNISSFGEILIILQSLGNLLGLGVTNLQIAAGSEGLFNKAICQVED